MKTAERGREKEDEAFSFLWASGFELLARNYRCRGGEVDLIGLERSTLIFVEVRYRSPADWTGGLESVVGRKRFRIERAARQYLASYRGNATEVRFDVVHWDEAGRISRCESAWNPGGAR